MRYYFYVNATRIAMMYSQIASSRTDRQFTEIGVDFKLVKTSWKPGNHWMEKDPVYTMVAAVEEEIYAREAVGTVAQPATWISGRQNLWVESRTSRDPGPGIHRETTFVVKSEDKCLVLLGSRANELGLVIKVEDGRGGGRLGDISNSTLFERFQRRVRMSDPASEDIVGGELDGKIARFVQAATLPNGRWWESLECEFLAKRLPVSALDGTAVTVGIPLFIAFMD